MWEHSTLPTYLIWTVLVFLTKVNADTLGIGLLEVLWKVVEDVIDTWIKTEVKFHGVLHGGFPRQGIGTSIMEINVAQDLDSKYQDPLFLVFLELWELSDTLYHVHLLQTL